MERYEMRMPDLGEGTVSAEVIEWKVRVGDEVIEDAPLVEMSTDKAVVEVPSPVTGRVVALTGEPGDEIAVGAQLAVFAINATDTSASDDSDGESRPDALTASTTPTPSNDVGVTSAPRGDGAAPTSTTRALASPVVRRRARDLGLDLALIQGTGPGGRIRREDLDRAAAAIGATPPRPTEALAASSAAPVRPAAAPGAVEEIPVIGVRRVIAQRMVEATQSAPHFSYIDEVDVTELDTLRNQLGGDTKLTYLPFIARALAIVLAEFPQCNAHYDPDRNVIRRFAVVHVGIATQTPDGLKVPVVRDVLAHDAASLAAEIRRVSEAARNGTATRTELTGSTITITSLGELGGLAATPILNLPEVAIVGVNKAIDRVVVRNGGIVVRRMMNLSSSFDHRFVDGYEAAAMIQALKARLEHPETIFPEAV